MEPKVSVIIPAYNKFEFTIEAIESVLNQSYKNIEIIVVDDGSTDNTSDIKEIFKEKIIYKLKKNGGACSARNLGMKICTGDFIAHLDCDDIYTKDKIKNSINYLINNRAYGFIYTNVFFYE